MRRGWVARLAVAATATSLAMTTATTGAAQNIATPPKAMAADADPSFDVATIKPSSSDGRGKYFRVMGRTYQTHNTSLADLIEISYGVSAQQITGASAWLFADKFDITATPDEDGQPSGRQWLLMMQKLMAQRFKLTLHHEKQPLSVFVLSVRKAGPLNMTSSTSAGQYPSLEFTPVAGGVMLPAKNTTLGSFCQMMQQVVLDRPLVDQTGLTGRFDFQLSFKPDDSQFNGHPPRAGGQTGAEASLPSLAEALQRQLGLKLSLEKIPMDVVVIDHAEKPSEN